jgi:hypothetical protein
LGTVDSRLVSEELLEIWKEADMTQFETISMHFPAGLRIMAKISTRIISVSDDVSTRQLPM